MQMQMQMVNFALSLQQFTGCVSVYVVELAGGGYASTMYTLSSAFEFQNVSQICH